MNVDKTFHNLINFILFQTIWFAGVVWANQGLWLTIPCIGLLLYLNKPSCFELKLVAICFLSAFIFDGSLIYLELFILPAPALFLVPSWLIVIWLGFGLTLSHSLHYLLAKPVIATLAGAFFGPLAYHAGMALGALHFAEPHLKVTLILACYWAILMLFLSLFVKQKQNSLNKNELNQI